MELTNCFTEVILEIRLQTIRRTARQSTAQRWTYVRSSYDRV